MMQGDEEDVMDEIPLMQPQPCSPSRRPQVNPTCRSVRWYKQLLSSRHGQELDSNNHSTMNIICDMEAAVVSYYEKLQEQHSSLLLLLDDVDETGLTTPEPETDKYDENLASLDPLSAMLQEDNAKVNRQKEIELLYERDRRRNRGRYGPYIPDEPQNGDMTSNAVAYKQLINKDLLRLSSPHRQASLETNIDASSTNRFSQLKYLLYLFAISHPEAGYLQGMHEIASYCLYAMEKDEEFVRQQHTATLQAALSYRLTESIISFLYIAYDIATPSPNDATIFIKPVNPTYQATPLVQMSNRILQSLSLVDANLYSILQTSSQAIPYQLIFTKWIRLLFCREVVACATMAHADTVIFLWDALFDASHNISQQSSSLNVKVPPLQTVAEIFCVARLWHHTNTIKHLHHSSRATESNFLLHWLMNIPPEPIAEVRKILVRMNYILSLQIFSNNSSEDFEAQQLLLPPLNAVPPDIIAMTSSAMSRDPHRDLSPKHSTTQNSHSLWDGSGAGSSFFHAAAAALSQKDHSKTLSSFTETIASKTQSIQKLIVQEWENVQAQLIENPLYECGGEATADKDASPARPFFPAQQRKQEQNMYNLDYYGSNTSTYNERFGQQGGKRKWSEQLQRNVDKIHQYVVRKEQQPQDPSDADSQSKRVIWDALAELQSLQEEIKSKGL